MKAGEVIAERYRVERELGKGGMGAVFEALDTKFDVPVAVKIASPQIGDEDEFRERFKREAKIGNKLGKGHGFVRAFDWGALPDGQLYLAMDLIAGARPLDLLSGSLPGRIGRLREAARLVREAHRQGIVHRDLKPENFLVDPKGTMHLADFGLGKATDEEEGSGIRKGVGLTQTGIAMGTPRFMAPEQFEDTKSVDTRCDVFALGVMLYLALTNEFPFPGDGMNVYSQMSLVSLGRKPAPRPRNVDPTIPTELDAACSRALALEPSARTASVDAFLQDLDLAARVDALDDRFPAQGTAVLSGQETVIEPASGFPSGAPTQVGPGEDVPTRPNTSSWKQFLSGSKDAPPPHEPPPPAPPEDGDEGDGLTPWQRFMSDKG